MLTPWIDFSSLGKYPLIWDTRNIEKHKQCYFLARKGYTFNAYEKVLDILKKGYFVIGEFLEMIKIEPSFTTEEYPHFISIENSEDFLKNTLWDYYSVGQDLWKSVAITGTSGKTSSTHFFSSLWKSLSGKNITSIGTLGINIASEGFEEGTYPTMPDFIGFTECLEKSSQKNCFQLVFEATSHGLYENRLFQFLVDYGIFLNLSHDHLDFHKTLENYLEAKTLLFTKHLKKCGKAVICSDILEKEYLLQKIPQNICKIGYGEQKDSSFDFFLHLEEKKAHARGIEGVWTWYQGTTLLKKHQFFAPLTGGFHFQNLSACVSVLLHLGYDLEKIVQECENLPPIQGRMQQVFLSFEEKDHQPVVVVDYAHKPDALEKALQSLKDLLPLGGKLWCVVGCGGNRDATKRPLMGKIAVEKADHVIFTSDNPRTENPCEILREITQNLEGSFSNYEKEENRQKAIEKAILKADIQDIIIIAGKGHENYQIIGKEKFHFCDVEESLKALQKRKDKK